jgi:hypothetical protein
VLVVLFWLVVEAFEILALSALLHPTANSTTPANKIKRGAAVRRVDFDGAKLCIILFLQMVIGLAQCFYS